jgi:hypothetical protein
LHFHSVSFSSSGRMGSTKPVGHFWQRWADK